MNRFIAMYKYYQPFLTLLLFALTLASVANAAQELEAVEVYSQDELIELIEQDKHLQRIKADRCQIVEDIEARAEVMRVPAYQYLWADMLNNGVCVAKKPSHGIDFMRQAADQGLPFALEKMGHYYANGYLVQQDRGRAIVYLREASALGNLSAQLQLAELFVDGYGSPYDYQDLYYWLYNAVTNNKTVHKQISTYLSRLERLMHPGAVSAAKRQAYP